MPTHPVHDTDPDPDPDLSAERDHLTRSRAQLARMRARTAALDAHPDAHIFRSLPRCATVRAATLLDERPAVR